MNTYGERVKVTIFGESHGPAIGVVLDGVPAGEAIDMDAVRIQMRRRAPGSSDLTTHRSETDDPLVMSGILNGVTTGAPISAIFRNKDQNSAAYHPEIPRPSHADYAATVRFGGHADLRGGGPFSGRLTACLVFAGAVCRQILERRGITITANAVRVGQATGRELNFDMKRAILDARSAGDSVGSELECVVTGVPAGVGGLLFGGMESRIAGMLYAIPGVKGVEFGRGFARAVQSLAPGVRIEWFHQGGNKEARILSNSATALHLLRWPRGWNFRWPELYAHLTTYRRRFRANRWHDAADVVTGIVEREAADRSRGRVRGVRFL